MDKLRIRQAIVVEGKYDQNALRQELGYRSDCVAGLVE